MRAIGVDVGGTSVKAAVMVDGRCLGTGRSARYERPEAAGLAEAMRGAIGLAIDASRGESGESADAIDAIGLCVPGRRDASGLRVLASVNVPGLVGHRLDDLVRAVLAGGGGGRADGNAAISVHITSDAQAAAIDVACELGAEGEMSGAGTHAAPAPDMPGGAVPTPGGGENHERRRLLALSLGTGVGACVLDDLEPLHVSATSPGHIGQLDVSLPLADGSIPIGPDGGRGGLEGYIGLPALIRRLGPPIETVMDRVRSDDPGLAALARAIRTAHAIYRPHAVALLGGVGIGLSRHAERLRELVDTNLTSVARPGWRLMFGRDEFHAARGAARGAARRAAEGARPAGEYLCFLRARPTFLEDRTPAEAAVIGQHFEYLKGLHGQGRAILFGRCLDAPPLGLVILMADSQEAAEAMMRADPAVVAGIFTAEVRAYKVALADVRRS